MTSRISHLRGHTFAALEERDFAWYFFGNVSFFLAMQMGFLVRAFVAFDLTDRAVAVGAVSAGGAVATLTLAPFAGVVADRVNKRTLLLVTQIMTAGSTLLLSLLILTDLLVFWHLIPLSFLFGGLFASSMPSRQAVVPLLVPRHKLMNAVSLTMAAQALTAVVAPSVAGMLIDPIGPGWVYMITVILLLAGFPAIYRVPRHGMVAVGRAKPFLADFVQGIAYIRRDRLMFMLIALGLLFPFFAFPVQQLSVVFAEDVFDVGTSGFGLLVAGIGVGGLLGTLLAASFDRVSHKGRIMALGAVFHGLLILIYSQTPWFAPAAIVLALGFLGGIVFLTTNNAVVQAQVPDALRGRVVAVLMMVFGTIQIGVLPLTLAADAFGPRTATTIWGGLSIATILVFLLISRRLRELRIEPLAQTALSPAQAARLVAQGKITQAEADRLSHGGLETPSTEAPSTEAPSAEAPSAEAEESGDGTDAQSR